MRLIDADTLRDEWLGAIGEFTANEVLDSIDDIPTVPQEMSAREYVKARSRMCDAQYELFGSDEHDMTACIECPLEDYCEGVKKDAEAEVAIVEKWVREHPERSEE